MAQLRWRGAWLRRLAVVPVIGILALAACDSSTGGSAPSPTASPTSQAAPSTPLSSATAAAGSGLAVGPVTPSCATTSLGCSPPKDRCSAVWVRAWLDRAAVPPDRQVSVRGCDRTWIVADIDATGRGCVAMDGNATLPGCSGPGMHVRWFGVTTPSGWTLVAAGAGPGCATVHAAEPHFPAALCAGLGARKP